MICYDPDGNKNNITLSDTLYVPDLEANLISVRKLVARGANVSFDTAGCTIMREQRIAATAVLVRGLYELITVNEAMKTVEQGHREDCLHQWHRKLGHRDPDAVQDIIKKKLATGIQITDCGLRAVCECCLEAKATRVPFPKQSTTSCGQTLDLVHVDVCGPMNTATPGGCRYFLTVIDDCSRYCTVYFLREKSEAELRLKEFVSEMKTTFGRPPKIIRSDNGGEFKNKALDAFCKKEGIRQQFTTPHTP